MKFAHISDLHLGLRLYEMRMTEEQRYILEEITGLLKEEKPDALLISGDIYDRPVPPEEAVEMLSDFLGRVRALGISIFMISGNHDSPERISFGEKILGLGDVHVAGKYDGKIKKVVKEDKYGRINFFLLPYIKPSYVNAYLEEDKKIRKDPEPAGEKGTDKDSDKGLNLYQRAVEEAIATDPPDTSERNVILAHQFVMGATRSESEEVIVGLVDSIGAEVFDGFDYVALGHLHKPQHIGEKRVRYCGTPLKYSFSEEKNKKSVTFVEMKQKGDMKISAKELKPRRDVRSIKGRFPELLAGKSDDYIRVVLTDDAPVPNAFNRLRESYPNILKLEYDAKVSKGTGLKSVFLSDTKTPAEIFEEFYERVNERKMTAGQKRILDSIIEKTEE